ncbi:YciI family protein [Nocardiopsis lambiniae]|uniref:YciI family protein n=1 Tax=Nocardiopsis lambiniae TaxID=3075539 RepID=A0ABU2M3R6_9ACTN|nr:YciI family protein [Nocardiopsis sp. DSM 44743]MDT0327272.1 YciI family protein [Nocardiopsis sp. DSM 44743]
MRFLMLSRPEENARTDEGLYVEMAAFVEELTAAGVLVATGGLEPGGVRVASHGDEITVTDGPFTESKEAVAGFALIDVATEEEALELARRFRRIVGDGESVIRRVFS